MEGEPLWPPPLLRSLTLRKISKSDAPNAKWAEASTGLPCRAHRSIDQIDGCLERGVYIQIRGVEQDCVFGLNQGRGGSAFVAFIAPSDIGKNFRL
jgi:hypothetical protein